MNDEITKWAKRIADPIAVVLEQIRPDWQMPGIMAALADPKLRDLPADLVACAAIRAAANPAVRTPAVIPMDGAHWHGTGEPARKDRPLPVSSADWCHTHPGQPAGNCGGCRADAKVRDDDTAPSEFGADWRSALQAAKQARADREAETRERVEEATR